MSSKLEFSEFTKRAISTHGRYYLYDKSSFIGTVYKMNIMCPMHGAFKQEPKVHMRGSGCYYCGLEICKRKNKKKYLKDLIKVNRKRFGDKYTIVKKTYTKRADKVKFICVNHGIQQNNTYSFYKNKYPCKQCIKEDNVELAFSKRADLDDFISRSIEIFGDRFTYTNIHNFRVSKKIDLICNKHGKFRVQGQNHLIMTHGGCKECYLDSKSNLRGDDVVYAKRIRQNISIAIRKRGLKKKKSTIEILGADIDFVIDYLHDNKYGFKLSDSFIDIDHIVPISSANGVDEIHDLCHYSNLQLLPSHYNRNIKNNKPFDKKHFDKWMKKEKNTQYLGGL